MYGLMRSISGTVSLKRPNLTYSALPASSGFCFALVTSAYVSTGFLARTHNGPTPSPRIRRHRNATVPDPSIYIPTYPSCCVCHEVIDLDLVRILDPPAWKCDAPGQLNRSQFLSIIGKLVAQSPNGGHYARGLEKPEEKTLSWDIQNLSYKWLSVNVLFQQISSIYKAHS